jgi:hypothetical protein
VSTARRACVSNCSLPNRTYSTTYAAYLPLPINVSYDLACFVDANGSDARDSGDLVHSSQVSTSADLSRINVTLSELP